jgi:GNAT superfamily N-acetyltransferase
MEVRELETEDEWLKAFPVMNQLRTDLDRETYLDYLLDMTADGYRLFAGVVDGECVALAGVGIEVNMYYGRHLWVYELVTHEDHRSRGYGGELLSFLEGWAADKGCERLALSTGLQRDDAQRFYEEKAGMEPASYVYKKPVEEGD